MEQKLLLIDGNSLINRAYYAFGTSYSGNTGLSWNGYPTNATYGFLNMLFKAVADIEPTQIAIAFDVRAKTFRHKMYDGYKCTRKSMPDDLACQLADLKELLRIMDIAYLESEGFEADDIIGSLCKNSPDKTGAYKSIILSADRDGLQLVDEHTELHLTKTGVTNLEVWDTARIRREYDLTPKQLIDLKSLMGDKSDCIPGANGVGEKTALALMQQYGSVENIYENLDKLGPSVRAKLGNAKETVYLSRDLARIKTDISLPKAAFTFPFPMDKQVYDAFEARGFKSFCKRPSLWREDYYSDLARTQAGRTTETVQENNKPITEVNTPDSNQPIPEPIKVTELGKTLNIEADYLAISYDDSTYCINEYVFPLRVDLLSGGFDESEIISAVKNLLESKTPKIVFDSKTLKEKLRKYNITLGEMAVDVRICEHLLTGKTSFTNRKVTLSDLRLLKDIEAAGMLPLYRDIELPLVDVLIDMQQNGAKMDLKALSDAADKLKNQIENLSNRIYEFAGSTFNINSPQQLGGILFNKLGIETTRKTKTGFSTDEFELTKKAGLHPIVPYILRYRKAFKLYSTYIQGFRAQADSGGFVHSTFNNTGTVTGRLSSSEPNIQNIPARSEDAEFIRKLFISRYPNGKIIAADYSQIELRLLAHFSGDQVMKHAFLSGRDIHTETAAKIFGVSDAGVTADMRRTAKAVNFGIVYGISAFGLSENIGCSVSAAADFIEKYFAQFPSVKSYLDKCRDSAINSGFASTIFGRRRPIPELYSGNRNIAQFGVRAAMNMPMQGSASDIIKKAMVEIRRVLEGNEAEAGTHPRLDKVKLIAQVHDELIFDCAPDQTEQASKIVKEIMENTVSLSVPISVDVKLKDTF